METTWSIETHGDPQGALHQFIAYVWQAAGLEGMILSKDVMDEKQAGAIFIAHTEQLEAANPFWPAMRANTARYLPEVLSDHPVKPVGALLRPCELRALNKMDAIHPFTGGRLLTICVDCLGTYPAGDLAWRTERGEPDGDLSGPVLQFARMGGMAVYRYRPACQVCRSPRAEAADINIGVLGLPARQQLLVCTPKAETGERLHFSAFPAAPAAQELVVKRERVIDRMTARNAHTRERIVHGLLDILPSNLDAFVRQLNACGDCQECLSACPICSVQGFDRGPDGRYRKEDVARWLVNCAGCGMCEQACSRNLPLGAIFTEIRGQLREQATIH